MKVMKKSSALRIWLSGSALAIYLAFVLYVTLTPSPIDLSFRHDLERLLEELHERGVPGVVDYNFVEFTSNVALFVPGGFIAFLLLPRRGWWLVLLIGPIFSIAIEFAQHTFLPARFPTVADVLANSIGVFIGAILAIILRFLVSWRDGLVLSQTHADLRAKPESTAGLPSNTSSVTNR